MRGAVDIWKRGEVADSGKILSTALCDKAMNGAAHVHKLVSKEE